MDPLLENDTKREDLPANKKSDLRKFKEVTLFTFLWLLTSWPQTIFSNSKNIITQAVIGATLNLPESLWHFIHLRECKHTDWKILDKKKQFIAIASALGHAGVALPSIVRAFTEQSRLEQSLAVSALIADCIFALPECIIHLSHHHNDHDDHDKSHLLQVAATMLGIACTQAVAAINMINRDASIGKEYYPDIIKSFTATHSLYFLTLALPCYLLYHQCHHVIELIQHELVKPNRTSALCCTSTFVLFFASIFPSTNNGSYLPLTWPVSAIATSFSLIPSAFTSVLLGTTLSAVAQNGSQQIVNEFRGQKSAQYKQMHSFCHPTTRRQSLPSTLCTENPFDPPTIHENNSPTRG